MLSLLMLYNSQEICKNGHQPIFWDVWSTKGYIFPESPDSEENYRFHTFIFHPDEGHLELVQTRNLITLEEEDIEPIAKKYHWDHMLDISSEVLRN